MIISSSFIILAFSLLDLIFGHPAASQNARGNELYRAKQYDQALTAYRAAQLKEPESMAMHYNIGNTLYRQGKYDEAIQQYSKATTGPVPLNAQANYNLGNSLYRAGKLDEAAEAYKRTLRLTPNDTDAKYNLEFIRKQRQPPPKPSKSQNDQQQKPPQDQPQPNQQQHKPSPTRPEQKNQPQKPEQTPGEMTREEAERLLNALNQPEQDLQKQRRKQAQTKQRQPDKDW